MSPERTPARKKARELAKYLRGEHPDYIYMKELFRYLREELAIAVPKPVHKLPPVPTEAEIQCYYQKVWAGQNLQDVVLIKLLLYTGVRVGEVVKIGLADVDLGQCQIRITDGKGHKDRQVPFPPASRKRLACTFRRCTPNRRRICLSRVGSGAIARGACARSWRVTVR